MPEIEVEYLANQARIFGAGPGPLERVTGEEPVVLQTLVRSARPAFALQASPERWGGGIRGRLVTRRGSCGQPDALRRSREPDQDQGRGNVELKRGEAGALDHRYAHV